MGIREDMEVAFDEMLDGEHPERQALLESALWAAKWMAGRIKSEASNAFRLAYNGSDEHAKYCFYKVQNRIEDISIQLTGE